MSNFIPTQCLSHLPFREERFSDWAESDLEEFLVRLFDKDMRITGPDGIEFVSNSSDYAQHVIDRNVDRCEVVIRELKEFAGDMREVEGPTTYTIFVPDFEQDVKLGRAFKYLAAWDGLESEVLGESAAFSLSHMLEQECDLECSVLLAQRCFYRQAVQVLRSFLEAAVLHLHFCLNDDDFQAWRAGTFRVPSIRRKKDGLLCVLRDAGEISTALADEAANLYDQLNGFIHGSEEHMIHRGTQTGTWRGHTFKQEDFHEWCDYLSRTVEIGIHFLAATTGHWLIRLRATPGMCSRCHGTDFDESRVVHAGRELRRMKCRQCHRVEHWRISAAEDTSRP